MVFIIIHCMGSNPSKGKVIPILNVIKPYAIKPYGEFRYSSTILDLGTRWCVVSCMPLPLYPRDTHWIGGWVCPRAGLDTMEKRKKPLSLPGIKPWLSSL
jgi:hypothetical protein